MASIMEKLGALLERNRNLEEENAALKQELLRLRAAPATAPEPKQQQRNAGERTSKPPLMPSTRVVPAATVTAAKLPPPPPPPPPPPSRLRGGGGGGGSSVRRVPEVVELYRSLSRKDGRSSDLRAGAVAIQASATNPREMIGEIENRSSYLLAIKSDVETQGEFIGYLTREVETAAHDDISGVEAFVKWLDEELSLLADERAVLKHFPSWPERKTDAMREAAFGYRDLKDLADEAAAFRFVEDDLKDLKRALALQDKVECGVHNLERTREGAGRRYREFQIPCDWMLDTGLVSQLKAGSMKLAKEYMKRVALSLRSAASAMEDVDGQLLLLQGVRFAFRVHQFVGGFDEDSRAAFQELKMLAGGKAP